MEIISPILCFSLHIKQNSLRPMCGVWCVCVGAKHVCVPIHQMVKREPSHCTRTSSILHFLCMFIIWHAWNVQIIMYFALKLPEKVFVKIYCLHALTNTERQSFANILNRIAFILLYIFYLLFSFPAHPLWLLSILNRVQFRILAIFFVAHGTNTAKW